MATQSSATKQKEWDLVVYGATGDAGTAIALYVANNIHAYKKSGTGDGSDDVSFRWAIAGRSEDKLNRLRSRIIVSRSRPSANDEIGVLTANVSSVEETSKLASSTRVLISAIGPYTVLGENIYKACVNNGTNYVDITGEVDWVASMREKYQKRARETGSTLCSFAGYDCVPCDIMTYAAHQVLSECDSGGGGDTVIASAESVVRVWGYGTFPRGTIRTVITKLSGGMSFPVELVRFALDANDHRKTAFALVRWLLPRWSPEFGAFTIPHFMGWCNIPVVYNSHGSVIDCTFHDRMALPYSQNCPISGYGLMQTLLLYTILLVVSPWFLCIQIVAAFIPSTSKLLLRLFDSLEYRGNKQNNQQQLDDSVTEVWNYVTSNSGSKAIVHLKVKGDPGIKGTALLAVETAFSMLTLLDRHELPKGVIGTPSEIVGDTLVDRLQDEETIGRFCTLTVTVDESKSGSDHDVNNKKED